MRPVAVRDDDRATARRHRGLGQPTELPAISGDITGGEVFGEYYAEGTTTPMFMVQRGNRKAIVADGDPPQLFDVEADPEELNNLATSRPDEIGAIEAEVEARWDRQALTERVLLSQHRRAFVSRVMRTQGIDWDFTPSFDGRDQYIRNSMPIGELEDRSRFPRIGT